MLYETHLRALECVSWGPTRKSGGWPRDTRVNERQYSFIFTFEVLKAVTTKVCVFLSATPILFHRYVPMFQRKLLSSLSRPENRDKKLYGVTQNLSRTEADLIFFFFLSFLRLIFLRISLCFLALSSFLSIFSRIRLFPVLKRTVPSFGNFWR